jgi:hypothetical protein
VIPLAGEILAAWRKTKFIGNRLLSGKSGVHDRAVRAENA